jgi:AP-3 complex subunit sigma
MFENVCEFDLIFNFETLHTTLAEMIVGGVVIETNLDRIVDGVRAQGRVPKRPPPESGVGGAVGSAVGRLGSLGAFGRGEGVWVGR